AVSQVRRQGLDRAAARPGSAGVVARPVILPWHGTRVSGTKANVSSYRPGRALRAASSEKLKGYLIWGGWMAACGIAVGKLALGPPGWIAAAVVPFVHRGLVATRLRDYNHASRHGHAALKNGNPEIAEQEFSDVRVHFRWPSFLPRLTDHNRAYAQLRQ